MADTHPYTTSQGGLVQTINQFRQAFPAKVDADTLKRLGFAPNNESYIINVLRFLGVIDDEGNKIDAAARVFNLHDDQEFSKAFGALVETAYADLFEIRGEGAWDLDVDALIGFFRANDGTSSVVGKRQAATFQLLAGFSGHGEIPAGKSPNPKVGGKQVPKKKASQKSATSRKTQPEAVTIPPSSGTPPPIGLTVRVEINLPPDGDQATYDRIFKSIRDNLLNG